MTEKHFNLSNEAILAKLKAQYANDEDALEYIARTEIDLEYMCGSQYKGTQTARQHLLELVSFLENWH